MEIYFDKETIKILRYIKRNPYNTLDEILNATDKEKGMLIINLCRAEYIVCKRADGTFENFKGKLPHNSFYNDKFLITHRGKELLDNRFDRLWQWSIPVIISTAALIVSLLTAI